MSFRTPLADKMRPQTLDEVVGQQELLGENKPLHHIIEQKVNISLILWGPPGTGKSSLAQIIAKQFDYPLAKFNASIDNKAKLDQFIKT